MKYIIESGFIQVVSLEDPCEKALEDWAGLGRLIWQWRIIVVVVVVVMLGSIEGEFRTPNIQAS